MTAATAARRWTCTSCDSSNEDRARARRAGLVEFEVRRTPDQSDGSIARACRTSPSTVAAARRRLRGEL